MGERRRRRRTDGKGRRVRFLPGLLIKRIKKIKVDVWTEGEEILKQFETLYYAFKIYNICNNW